MKNEGQAERMKSNNEEDEEVNNRETAAKEERPSSPFSIDTPMGARTH